MKTTTLSFNKDNWSGETTELNVTEFAGTYEWEQNGYKIELKNFKRLDGAEDKADDGWAWTQYDIHIDGHFADSTVGKFEKDKAWEARGHDDTISRQSGSELGQVVAASQLLFNTL